MKSIIFFLILIPSLGFAMSDNGDGTRTISVGIGGDYTTVAELVWVHPVGLTQNDTLQLSGDLSTETLDLAANADWAAALPIDGVFKLAKIVGKADVPMVPKVGSRITGPIELGDNVKMGPILVVHE